MLVEREADHGGVVDVGIEIVVVLERPAARLDAGAPDAPSRRAARISSSRIHSAPRRRAGSSAATSGLRRARTREPAVPDGRLARLRTQAVAVLDEETVPAREPSPDVGRVRAVAAAGERDQRPHPGWLDPAPGAVQLLPVDDPPLCQGERPLAPRLETAACVPGERAVAEEPQRYLSRGTGPRLSSWQARSGGRGARAVVEDDGERDDRLPRPAGKV